MKNNTLITLIIVALILCPISTTTVFSIQARSLMREHKLWEKFNYTAEYPYPKINFLGFLLGLVIPPMSFGTWKA